MSRLPLVLRIFLVNRFLFMLLAGSCVAVSMVMFPLMRSIARGEFTFLELAAPGFILVNLLAFFYGAARAWHFHPIFDSRYHDWLANSPWNPSHALPKGPLHLVWSDAIVVLALCLPAALLVVDMGFSHGVLGFEPSVAFFTALTLVWTLANGLTGQIQYVYLVLWVPVLFGLMRVPTGGLMAIPLITAGIAWLGLRRSLRSFPWHGRGFSDFWKRQEMESKPVLGWPYQTLLEEPRDIQASPSRAFLEAALLAGWAWLLIGAFNEESTTGDVRAVKFFVPVLGTLMAACKLGAYSSVLCANLCWGMRVARKKWILPHHDQIFLAPILMLVLAWGSLGILHDGVGLSIELASAVTLGIVYFIARAMGPRISELKYTGIHSKFDAPLLQKEVFQTKRSSTQV